MLLCSPYQDNLLFRRRIGPVHHPGHLSGGCAVAVVVSRRAFAQIVGTLSGAWKQDVRRKNELRGHQSKHKRRGSNVAMFVGDVVHPQPMRSYRIVRHID